MVERALTVDNITLLHYPRDFPAIAITRGLENVYIYEVSEDEITLEVGSSPKNQIEKLIQKWINKRFDLLKQTSIL